MCVFVSECDLVWMHTTVRWQRFTVSDLQSIVYCLYFFIAHLRSIKFSFTIDSKAKKLEKKEITLKKKIIWKRERERDLLNEIVLLKAGTKCLKTVTLLWNIENDTSLANISLMNCHCFEILWSENNVMYIVAGGLLFHTNHFSACVQSNRFLTKPYFLFMN